MQEFVAKDFYGNDETWVVPVTADDVTQEILDYAEQTTDAWFPDGPIEWEDVWDRMEGYEFSDGKKLSWGDEFGTPAMNKVQRYIRKIRSQG